MSFLEKWIYLNPKNKGLVFGKYRLSLQESYKNLCLVAPTGSGKTTRYVIPNILNASGSVVVTDPSGEIFSITSAQMKKRGYHIQVLSPAQLKESLFFNPMDPFHTHQELKRLATILGSHNAGSDPFWNAAAINLIYICLVAVKADFLKQNRNITEARKLINLFGVNQVKVDQLMKKRLDNEIYSEYRAFIAQDEKVISSILSTARTALDLWSDPCISSFTQTSTVDLSALREKKSIVYIIVPEHQIQYFSLIINLFYSACFEYCIENQIGESVFFFLDEFGNIGKINHFGVIATTLRKRNCSISIILQEFSQIESIYGATEAKTIVSGGMAHKLYFSGLDLDTCRYVEAVLGKRTEQGKVSEEQRNRVLTVGNPLMTADEIRMMPSKSAILISGRMPPIKLKLRPYFHR